MPKPGPSNPVMNTSNIKVIFQDVDGCLNPEDGEHFSAEPNPPLSSKQIAMLQSINAALDASSVEYLIINTGRPYNLIQTLLEHLPSSKARYVLLEHACVLYDREAGAYLDCAQLASHYGLDDLATRYLQVENIHRLTEWYHAEGQQALEAHYKTPLPALEKVGNFSFEIPNQVDGEELLDRVESMAREHLTEGYTDRLQFLRSDRYIDVLPGIHKLDGIHLMVTHLGVDLDQALAVGDYLNDLPVFEEFHRVMCPANAHPRIQALARSKGPCGLISEASYGASLLDLFCRLN